MSILKILKGLLGIKTRRVWQFDSVSDPGTKRTVVLILSKKGIPYVKCDCKGDIYTGLCHHKRAWAAKRGIEAEAIRTPRVSKK